MKFADRTEAGRHLAEALKGSVSPPVVVLALPRGGVPVAAEIARVLNAPLDVIGVRKIGAPGHPELGVGAVAEGGGLILDSRILDELGISKADVTATIDDERREVVRRVDRYREGRPLTDLHGRTVIVVDDGLATGVTATAAVRAVRAQGAARVVLAVPVASAAGRDDLAREADEVVCVAVPRPFVAVGRWYHVFDQTSDDEVVRTLERAAQTAGGSR